MEDEKLRGLDFVELNACSAGCVGGVLNIENPYVAAVRLKRLARYRPVSCNHMGDSIPPEAKWDREMDYTPVMQLDQNPFRAMELLEQMGEIEERLRGLDCGSCGAPPLPRLGGGCGPGIRRGGQLHLCPPGKAGRGDALHAGKA